MSSEVDTDAFNCSKHRAAFNNLINKTENSPSNILRKTLGKYHKTSFALTAVKVPARGPVFIPSGNRSVEIV